MRAKLTTGALLILACFALPANVSAQRPSSDTMNVRVLADALQRSAISTADLTSFGEAIAREVLLSASEQVRNRRTLPTDIALNLEFRVRELPPLYSVPQPGDIDVCWEICPTGGRSFLQCYINCSAPSFGTFRPPFLVRTCDAIWEDYQNADNMIIRIQYLRELLLNDCINPRLVRLQVDRQP